MNEQAQRIAIAEACGALNLPKNAYKIEHLSWRGEDLGCYFLAHYSDGSARPNYTGPLPDYLNDLNAMHGAVKSQPASVMKAMRFWLFNLCDEMTAHEATAAQRAEAFLRTLGKWVPE